MGWLDRLVNFFVVNEGKCQTADYVTSAYATTSNQSKIYRGEESEKCNASSNEISCAGR